MLLSLFSATTAADVHTAGELAQIGYEQLMEVISYRPDTPERDISYDTRSIAGNDAGLGEPRDGVPALPQKGVPRRPILRHDDRMSSRWLARFALTVVAAAAVATTTASAESTLSLPTWVQKANAICATGNAAIRQLPKPTTIAQAITVVQKQTFWTDWQADKIRSLPPPAAQATRISRMVGEIDAVVRLWRRVIIALKAGDGAQATALIEQARPHVTRANTIARGLGARTCAATS